MRKAKRLLRHDSYLTPVAFIVHAGGVVTVGLSFENREQKDKAYRWVSDRCRTLDADAVILINESWMVLGETTEHLPPSEHPRRQEVISMAIVGPSFQPTLTLIPFRRKGRKIRFEEKVTQSKYPEVEVLMIPKWWTDAPKIS